MKKIYKGIKQSWGKQTIPILHDSIGHIWVIIFEKSDSFRGWKATEKDALSSTVSHKKEIFFFGNVPITEFIRRFSLWLQNAAACFLLLWI